MKNNIGKALTIGVIVGAIGIGSMFSFADKPEEVKEQAVETKAELNQEDNYRYIEDYEYTEEDMNRFHEQRIKDAREDLNRAKSDKNMNQEDIKYWEDHLDRMDKDFKDGNYNNFGCYGHFGGGGRHHNRNIEYNKEEVEKALKDGKITEEDAKYWREHFKIMEENYEEGNYNYGHHGYGRRYNENPNLENKDNNDNRYYRGHHNGGHHRRNNNGIRRGGCHW